MFKKMYLRISYIVFLSIFSLFCSLNFYFLNIKKNQILASEITENYLREKNDSSLMINKDNIFKNCSEKEKIKKIAISSIEQMTKFNLSLFDIGRKEQILKIKEEAINFILQHILENDNQDTILNEFRLTKTLLTAALRDCAVHLPDAEDIIKFMNQQIYGVVSVVINIYFPNN
ncbi:MAG: hypothetical protein Q8784_01850 [Vigna little leaf phytoplasma]|nr:hypothetical protein [Vigna little leaf phytoplasma]